MNLGLLDLPAPLWDLIDGALDAIGIPALVRVTVYAVASAWVSMAIYRRTSRQQELTTLAAESRALRAELAEYDGEFSGLMQRVRRLMRLSARHLRLSFTPAMLGGLPLLLVLPWLSNTFSYSMPTPGAAITVVPEQLAVPATSLRWLPDDANWDADLQGWRIVWPDPATPLRLTNGETSIVQLPPPAASDVIHRRLPWLNWLIANPAGYLPDAAPMQALQLDLAPRPLLPWGPSWLSGWLAVYFFVLIVASLWLRWRWRLQ